MAHTDPDQTAPRGDGDIDFWRNHTQISLRPVLSILGLYGFAGATFIVAANLAGWYGSDTTRISCSRSPPCSAG